MTATAPEDPDLRSGALPGGGDGPGTAGGDDGGNGDDPGYEVAPVVRRSRARTKQRSRTTLYLQAGCTFLFVALLAGLGWVGYQSSLRITGGGTARVTNPKEPGYVAEVKPTPVDMVAVTDSTGALASVLIVTSGADGKGGTVSALPASVVAPGFEGGEPIFLSKAMADAGLDGLRQQLGLAMTFGFTGAESVSADSLQALAEQVGPITISNVDNLIERAKDGTETVKYRAGEITLQPNEVADFLAFAGADESVFNQGLRHQAVWQALLTGLKGKDLSGMQSTTSASDGSGDPGFLGLLPGLLSGDVAYDPVPLEVQPVPGTLYKVYRPDPAALPAWVARTVPFPIAATPGQRARVRLLNGTTDKNAALIVAPKVVAAGGEISLVGNADSFDQAVTRVEYLVPEAKAAAESIATALGVKATRATGTAGSVDVDVIVGRDRSS
jgi:hypothetical protein